jgi:hypothetical protein
MMGNEKLKINEISFEKCLSKVENLCAYMQWIFLIMNCGEEEGKCKGAIC